MDEQGRKPWRRNGQFGRKWPEPKGDFPPWPQPEGNARFSIKQVAYLHAYCGNEPRDIVARYSRTISLAQVHLALAHYYQSKDAIDAEIAAEMRFNASRSLDEPSMSLPSMRDAPPAEAAIADVTPVGASPGREKV